MGGEEKLPVTLWLAGFGWQGTAASGTKACRQKHFNNQNGRGNGDEA
jgi:hypothetical protein